MPRIVRTFLPLVGEPPALVEALEGDPVRWLPGARRDGSEGYTLPLRAGAFGRTVRVSIGAPWRAGATRWRSLQWEPVSEEGAVTAVDRLLPALDGELGLHVEPGGRITLLLDGRYRPPGGALGTAADVVAMGRVAQGTVQRFLEEVAARLSAEAVLLGGGRQLSPTGG